MMAQTSSMWDMCNHYHYDPIFTISLSQSSYNFERVVMGVAWHKAMWTHITVLSLSMHEWIPIL